MNNALGATNVAKKEKYLERYNMAVIIDLSNDDYFELSCLNLKIVPEIELHSKMPELNYISTSKENAMEMKKLIPFVLKCTKAFYNRKTHSIETVILPNPYFKEVFILDEAVEKLMEYIDALLDFNEKQGKEVEDYVPFDISAVALMIDPGNN